MSQKKMEENGYWLSNYYGKGGDQCFRYYLI